MQIEKYNSFLHYYTYMDIYSLYSILYLFKIIEYYSHLLNVLHKP